ncbi:cytidine deaminase-like protein [Coniochaeta sp. 2T2.1]|nr:cytidine deaminase-like protein [Coniochaeta sp. 2T2.1]
MAPPINILSSKTADHVSAICKEYNISLEQFETLRSKSVEAKSVAYCPYSNFRVGCALLTADDTIVTGANVENASYPVGTCAERVTIGKAVTEGHRGKFKVIAVATDISPPASPCGMCRQFIREFCDLQMPILMFDQNLDFVVLRLEDLLPLSFGPEHLQIECGDSSTDNASTRVYV